MRRWLSDIKEFIDDTNTLKFSIPLALYHLYNSSTDVNSSQKIMTAARANMGGDLHPLNTINSFLYDCRELHAEDPKLDPEQYFMLRRDIQDKMLKKAGYIKGVEGDYGLVKKAVGAHNYPVYQRKKDSISRDNLIPIGNVNDWYMGPDNTALVHADSYPTAVYIDKQTGNFYQKAWDLNDYGGNGGSTAGVLGGLLDRIGNPMVFTTGYQPIVGKHKFGNMNTSPENVFWTQIEPQLKKVHNYDTIMKQYYNLLPEVVVTPKKRSIKTSRGK